jgi:hypothetical protein
VTASDPGRDAWSRLLGQLDEPPAGTVAEALVDARRLALLESDGAVLGVRDTVTVRSTAHRPVTGRDTGGRTTRYKYGLYYHYIY